MQWNAEQYDTAKAPQIDAGRDLIAQAAIREQESLLDLGCGTGKLTIELARLAAAGRVTGIDPSPEMLDKAQAAAEGLGNLRLLRIPAQAMEFTDEFDLVFSNSALQWIREQEDVIRRVFHSLRNGGRIAFQMPAKDFCTAFFDSIQGAIASLAYERFFEGWRIPWRFPVVEEFRDMLEQAGFRAIRVFSREYRLAFHALADVLTWWSSAGLRPYLAVLPEGAQEHFLEEFGEEFARHGADGGTSFAFRRLFAFAEK